jgi:glycosyltransferase involved in cell wall biosynthesis
MTAGSILFLIRSLHAGGAERQLVTLARGLHSRGRFVQVATFYPDGDLRHELVACGVPVMSLGKGGRWEMAAFTYRLVRLIRDERPAILHPYLPDANLLTGALRPLLPPLRLVWGARASNVDLARYDWVTRLAYGAARILARAADLIIVNSRAGEAYHREHGYPADRLRVVPNGIDTNHFRPDAAGRQRLRAAWGVPPAAPLVGIVARLDPMKDHNTFLEGAARLAARIPSARFVAVGGGSPEYERSLRQRAAALGLENRLHWAGARNDMPAVYSALDVSTSTSIGEGFPNAVAEAMACGTPCVVTDAGDSAWITGELGEVVTPRDPDALADAWVRVIAQPAAWPSNKHRERIVREFSVERLVTDTERLLWPPR